MRRLVGAVSFATGLQRGVVERRIESCNPTLVAFRYVLVWLMFACPSMCATLWSGQPASRSRDPASCRGHGTSGSPP